MCEGRRVCFFPSSGRGIDDTHRKRHTPPCRPNPPLDKRTLSSNSGEDPRGQERSARRAAPAEHGIATASLTFAFEFVGIRLSSHVFSPMHPTKNANKKN